VTAASTPGPEVLRRALAAAVRAPSVHNTQPWRWRVTTDRLELHADPDRRLPYTDPDRRDQLVSCGSALGFLHVALAAFGAGHEIVRFPTGDRNHLATVRLTGTPPEPADRTVAALARAIPRRRTDRRPFREGVDSRHARAVLGEHAARYGTTLHSVTDAVVREHLAALEDTAAREIRARPGQAAELLVWTHRYPGSHDGVPAGSLPRGAPWRPGPDLGVRFPGGSLPARAAARDEATIMVLTTHTDDDPARLVAGEAAGIVLLAATALGLATCPLSRVLETSRTRADLARQVLRTADHPQLLLRVGRAQDDAELPETPRRSPADVLLH
jgi:nitroreductase